MGLLATVFLAGVLHGLGPDHLAAITAIGSAGRNFRRVTFFSVRFAAGHAAVIAMAGVLGYFGRLSLPPNWERGFELLAGALLVLSGVVLMAGLLTKKLSFHSHLHEHGSGEHRHFHMHWLASEGHRHAHGSLALALGALFALGGARMLLALAPIMLAQTVGASLLRVGAFTIGMVLAMTAYGALAGHALSRPRIQQSLAGARLACFGVALFSIAAGLMTLAPRFKV
jgi:hypothetical protein